MNFKYVAYNTSAGLVKGKMEARHELDVRVELQKQGLKPLQVAVASSGPTLETLFPSLFKVGSGEIVRFSRGLSTMLGSGGNLLRALDMLENETSNRKMRGILSDIRSTLDEGGSLSEALAAHPTIFNPLFVSVVEVGEFTGKLGPALDQLADILEKEQEAKAKAIRTLMYPVAIMALSAVTLGVLMTVALPPLLKVFNSMDAEIPMMTRVVVGTVAWISGNYLFMGIGIVVIIVLLVSVRKFERTSYALDSFLIRAPAIGSFIVAAELSRFSRTISMLLEAGVVLSSAMQLGTSGVKNRELKKAFTEAEESLLSGHGLLDTLRSYKIIPTLFVELILLGEETNSLKRTMEDAAVAYQKQLENRLDALLGMLEPVSTVVVGAIVGIIAFSMFVPIYSGLNAVQ